jgi:hypothetical protein
MLTCQELVELITDYVEGALGAEQHAAVGRGRYRPCGRVLQRLDQACVGDEVSVSDVAGAGDLPMPGHVW